MLVLNARFQHHIRMNSTADRTMLLEDLKVRFRFIRNWYVAEHAMAITFAVENPKNVRNSANAPSSTNVCVKETSPYLTS